MVTGRKASLKIKRKYERLFLKSALLLWIYQTEYGILSRFADYFFSGEQQPTGFLRFINKSLNKIICKCQILFERCEDYKQKIEKL